LFLANSEFHINRSDNTFLTQNQVASSRYALGRVESIQKLFINQVLSTSDLNDSSFNHLIFLAYDAVVNISDIVCAIHTHIHHPAHIRVAHHDINQYAQENDTCLHNFIHLDMKLACSSHRLNTDASNNASDTLLAVHLFIHLFIASLVKSAIE
jgi:hypothetical protein